MECADKGVGFIASVLIPLGQALLTFPLDFAGESEQHLRQFVEHLAARIVNHRHQQRMTPWGDVLPQLKCVEPPGFIGPLQYFCNIFASEIACSDVAGFGSP